MPMFVLLASSTPWASHREFSRTHWEFSLLTEIGLIP